MECVVWWCKLTASPVSLRATHWWNRTSRTRHPGRCIPSSHSTSRRRGQRRTRSPVIIWFTAKSNHGGGSERPWELPWGCRSHGRHGAGRRNHSRWENPSWMMRRSKVLARCWKFYNQEVNPPRGTNLTWWSTLAGRADFGSRPRCSQVS